jgi:hypothetical protein
LNPIPKVWKKDPKEHGMRCKIFSRNRIDGSNRVIAKKFKNPFFDKIPKK